MAAIPQFLLSNRTRETLALNSSGQLSGLFLWRADTQSGFIGSSRRMHCDHKPMMWRKRPLLWIPASFHRFRYSEASLFSQFVYLRAERGAGENTLASYENDVCNFAAWQEK